MAASLSDYQNVLGYQGLVGANPYLQYQGQIPMAGYYTGQGGNMPPTDASGRPIQSFLNAQAAHDAWAAANPAPPQTPGTTLNSRPQVDAVTNQAMGWNELMNLGLPAARPTTGDAYLDSINGIGGPNGPKFDPSRAGGPATGQQPQQAAAPTNPIDMRQAYLDALSNPGKVTTPGAQIYPGAAPTGAPQPSVLQQFLANNRAGTGAGGYSNAPFFQTLNALQAQKAQGT